MSNESKPLTKVHPKKVISEHLEELMDICAGIEVPSLTELKEMLRNYTQIEGNLWYSVFVPEWPEFYNLPELLQQVADKYSGQNPKLSELCVEMRNLVEDCRNKIDDALGARPNNENIDSKIIEESFYTKVVKPLYRRLTGICNQLRTCYLPKLHEITKLNIAQTEMGTPENKKNTIPSEIEKSTLPDDLITFVVAVKRYSVSNSTLLRAIKNKNIKSYRYTDCPKNTKHRISEREIAKQWPIKK